MDVPDTWREKHDRKRRMRWSVYVGESRGLDVFE